MSSRTRAALEVAKAAEADRAAEVAFLSRETASGSTHQRLFAKTFVRSKSPATSVMQPRSMKRASDDKSVASSVKSVRTCPWDTLEPGLQSAPRHPPCPLHFP